ncbi:unnamed protein product, partial [Allacma fusca]
ATDLRREEFLETNSTGFVAILASSGSVQWKEEFIKIDNTGLIGIGASSGSVPGNFLFIDTLIFVQGNV